MYEPATLFSFIEEICEGAGQIVTSYFGDRLEVDRKEDQTPVTRVDREVELFIRRQIEGRFPQHSILGEEFGETKKDSPYRWIIDPIDGTQSFIMGVPTFGTLIGFEVDGSPTLGAIYLPVPEKLLVGSPATGTLLNGVPARVSSTDNLSDAKLVLSDPRLLALESGQSAAASALCRAVSLVRGFGDCYGYFLVATGAADLMLDGAGGGYHDVAPILPVIEGAGGRLSTLEGAVDLHADSALASNGLLHDQALDAARTAY